MPECVWKYDLTALINVLYIVISIGNSSGNFRKILEVFVNNSAKSSQILLSTVNVVKLCCISTRVKLRIRQFILVRIFLGCFQL